MIQVSRDDIKGKELMELKDRVMKYDIDIQTLRHSITQRLNVESCRSLIIILFLISTLLLFPNTKVYGSLRRSPVVKAVEKVGPAVVNISTIIHERVNPMFPFSRDDFFKDFFPDLFARERTRSSLGSGVIIDGKEGYIITNHHVVERAAEIKVITSDKEEYKARIVGSDPRSDLAVLQIDVKERLPDIEMGNSDDLMIGESVIAIGNPFGLSHTVTTGVVSALNRSVRSDKHIYRSFIQTDASINPGNSGGPLLNIEGELIGINTAIYQKAEGIGFAIPINKARRIVKELFKAGEVRFPWLGLELQDLTPELRNAFALNKARSGVLISDVTPNGPAEGAGIKRGDILLNLESTPISTIEEYREALAEFTPSDPVRLTIFRRGNELNLSVQPTTFPQDLSLELFFRRMGIRVGEIDEATKKAYGIKAGLMIEEVRGESEADRIGLQRGDLLLKINNAQVNDLDQFNRAISHFRHRSALTLIVKRGPNAYSLTLPFN